MVALGDASTVQWGTVGEWFAAVSTMAAVIVALIFSLRGERSQEERVLTAVYIWVAAQDPDADHPFVIVIDNRTPFPIYRWRAQITLPTHTHGEPVEITTNSDEKGILPPGRFQYDLRPPQHVELGEAAIGASITFVDASGKIRRRMAAGQVETLTHAEGLP